MEFLITLDNVNYILFKISGCRSILSIIPILMNKKDIYVILKMLLVVTTGLVKLLFSLLYLTMFSKVSPSWLRESSFNMPLYLPLILCCRRACVIRGQVVAIDGTPLVGVNVSFLHHSDYGFTISRQDGRYVSIASNHCGGQILTSSYKSNGLDDTVFVSPSSFYLYFRKSLVLFIFSISQLNQTKFFFYYNCALLPKSS